MKLRITLALMAPILVAAMPCMWDYDTLAQERARFPSALELITGKFPRHSEAYYRWRIQDREERRRAGEDTPELFDDLAVAHSKLGQDERAIELMAEKESRFPGLYETAANLGTFYIHSGQLDEGAEEIARAISINPEAHFGREIYQELLVRYVIEKRDAHGSVPKPLQMEPAGMVSDVHGFWTFVKERRGVTEDGEAAEIQSAVTGVLGMMRFGNHDSLVLLEALSDLLQAGKSKDAKRLAARALLRASRKVEGKDVRQAYRGKAAAALDMQTPDPSSARSMTVDEIDVAFASELEEAALWWTELVARERSWIEGGADVDALFHETYLAAEPGVTSEGEEDSRGQILLLLCAVSAAVLAAVAYLVIRLRR